MIDPHTEKLLKKVETRIKNLNHPLIEFRINREVWLWLRRIGGSAAVKQMVMFLYKKHAQERRDDRIRKVSVKQLTEWFDNHLKLHITEEGNDVPEPVKKEEVP